MPVTREYDAPGSAPDGPAPAPVGDMVNEVVRWSAFSRAVAPSCS